MEKDGYHHGDLRQALLDASLRLVNEKGVAGLSLRAAARAAGVSAAAPYHHFENRAALIAALGEEGFSLLHREMEVGMERAGDDPFERLVQCGEAYVRFALRHSGHFRVMFRPELRDEAAFPELDAAGRPVFDALVAIVREAQAAGHVPAGDPRPYVLLCWSTVQGVANLVLEGPLALCFEGIDLDPDELGPLVSETLARVLSGAAAAQRRGEPATPPRHPVLADE